MPLPKDLYSETMLNFQHYLYYVAMVSLLAGMLLGNTTVILAALAIWILVALLYVANVGKILLHPTFLRYGHLA